MLYKHDIERWIADVDNDTCWEMDGCQEMHDWNGMMAAAKRHAYWELLDRRMTRVSGMITGIELIAIAGEVENQLHREDEDGMEVYAECYGQAVEYGLNDKDYAWEAPF